MFMTGLIHGEYDGYCYSKVKAFREQLEKLDEKTLDFATSQETKTLLGGYFTEFHQFRWDPNSPDLGMGQYL